MKKKHLRALASVENWLEKQNHLNAELSSAINLLKDAVHSAADDTEGEAILPAPKEIANEPSTLALFSDGGCRGNPGPGAYAYLIQDFNGAIVAEGVEFEGHTTNNKMELSGPLRGLQELKGILHAKGLEPHRSKVKVITDSKYVVEGMKSWVQGWKSRGWKKADNKAPENLELWQELDSIRNAYMDIEWLWVKGHGGHPQNEYCDRKANEAMDDHIS